MGSWSGSGVLNFEHGISITSVISRSYSASVQGIGIYVVDATLPAICDLDNDGLSNRQAMAAFLTGIVFEFYGADWHGFHKIYRFCVTAITAWF